MTGKKAGSGKRASAGRPRKSKVKDSDKSPVWTPGSPLEVTDAMVSELKDVTAAVREKLYDAYAGDKPDVPDGRPGHDGFSFWKSSVDVTDGEFPALVEYGVRIFDHGDWTATSINTAIGVRNPDLSHDGLGWMNDFSGDYDQHTFVFLEGNLLGLRNKLIDGSDVIACWDDIKDVVCESPDAADIFFHRTGHRTGVMDYLEPLTRNNVFVTNTTTYNTIPHFKLNNDIYDDDNELFFDLEGEHAYLKFMIDWFAYTVVVPCESRRLTKDGIGYVAVRIPAVDLSRIHFEKDDVEVGKYSRVGFTGEYR